jgi:protein transport protein SEC31
VVLLIKCTQLQSIPSSLYHTFAPRLARPMKLKEIHRTSTFAWSPEPTVPLLATGTVAGALDESFSNASALEIWGPDFADRKEYELGSEGGTGPQATVPVGSR